MFSRIQMLFVASALNLPSDGIKALAAVNLLRVYKFGL